MAYKRQVPTITKKERKINLNLWVMGHIAHEGGRNKTKSALKPLGLAFAVKESFKGECYSLGHQQGAV